MDNNNNNDISYIKTILSTGLGLAVFALAFGFIWIGLEHLFKKLYYWIFPQFKPQESNNNESK